MTCAACGAGGATGVVSLTPNVHYEMCVDCCDAWTGYASSTLVNRNNGAAVLMAFRRWCAARKRVVA